MLFWIDLETTGLNPALDDLLEVGAVATDDDLNIVSYFPDTLVKPSPMWHQKMDPFVMNMHAKSGLTDALQNASPLEARHVGRLLARWIAEQQPSGTRTLAGSSVHFDRGWLKAFMPDVDAMFSHRHADTSAVREFARRWWPDMPENPIPAAGAHRPTQDLLDSIALARHFKTQLTLKENK